MKPSFTQSPSVWLRASRTYQSPAEYASPIQSFANKGHRAVSIVGGVIFICLVLMLLTGVMK